eukprot:scaffold6881_cov127-Skeletonema_marinoi.AAC.7
MRLRRQELPTLNYNHGMEDSGGMTPAMDNNSNNKKSFGQHCNANAIISFVMKQKTLIRFVMAISLIFVSGFTVKGFSSAAVVDSSAHVELNTSHSYNPDKMHEYDFEDANTQGGDDNVVKKTPHGWQTFGFLQIREHFSCDVFDYVLFKPPSMKEWQMILDAYNKEVDSSTSLMRSNGEEAPPFYAKSIEGTNRNRGLFASRDIQEGEIVHDGTNSDVAFPDAMAYRRFVFSLPRRVACDITEWTWTQRLEQNGPMKIMLAINISAMLSTWQSTGFTSEDANVLLEPESEGSTSHLYYATRDIKRGEEILTDSTFRDWTNFAATDLGM